MSKKAHDPYQIRDSLAFMRKIIYFSIFDFILNGNICTLMNGSFFTLIALQTLL